MRAHAVRLTPGADLKEALSHFADARGLGAAFVLTCVGSLSRARLRMPGLVGEADGFVEWSEPLEIVSLTGTLCADGAHLHVSLSRRDGACVGGHLAAGCVVRTTAEVVLGEEDRLTFRRVPDAATGSRELSVAASTSPVRPTAPPGAAAPPNGWARPALDGRETPREPGRADRGSSRMKPHVICHMVSSVDGRTLGSRWRPRGASNDDLFERLHDKLEGDAWIVGRVTGQEFAKGAPYPAESPQRFAREAWFARRDARAYGVVLDAQGKIAWGRSEIGGDPIVVALTTGVSDAHLAGLREDGVSYVFAGEDRLDLASLLETLNRELGVRRCLVEGGGGANGSFLRAGLIDEISLAICPAVDGAQGAPAVFDSGPDDREARAPVAAMTLVDSQTLDSGAVWLRYTLRYD